MIVVHVLQAVHSKPLLSSVSRGLRLQVSAWILGPTWVAASLAGILMTLSRLAGHPQHSVSAGYVAATVVLGLLGLALLVFLQAVSPPGEFAGMCICSVCSGDQGSSAVDA
jgi:hypothetical protein